MWVAFWRLFLQGNDWQVSMVQVGWGQCNQSWMQGYCNKSCGRCSSSCVDTPPPGNSYSCAQQVRARAPGPSEDDVALVILHSMHSAVRAHVLSQEANRSQHWALSC